MTSGSAHDADRISTGEAVAFAATVSPAQTHMWGFFAFQENQERKEEGETQ